MSATQGFVPLNDEDKKAFLEMARPPSEGPAAPPPSDAPDAPPAAASPASAPEATPSRDTAVLQEHVATLTEMQVETARQLDALAKTLLEERGEDPNTERTPDLMESLVDESEAVRTLAQKLEKTEKTLGEVSAKLQVRETAELELQQQNALLSEGQDLFNKFPGLNEGDFKKIYEKIGQSEDVASRLSVEQVAVEVLGVDYLADRRKAAAPAPSRKSVPGSEPPPATLVDTSGPGGGAAGTAAPATGSIRDACQAALLTDRHKFGKFS
jgi:hypothetical protein